MCISAQDTRVSEEEATLAVASYFFCYKGAFFGEFFSLESIHFCRLKNFFQNLGKIFLPYSLKC